MTAGTIAGALLAAFSCYVCYGQTTGAKLEFEVVSVKPSPPPGNSYSVGCKGGPGSKDPGMLQCQNFSMMNLLTRAYGMPRYEITAPDWAPMVMFDITAKIPEGTTKEQAAVMLQNMLIDRFKLALHHESKEMAKYDLVLAKSGPKFKETVETPAPKEGDPPKPPAPSRPSGLGTDGFPVLGGNGMIMMNGRGRLFYSNWTMEQVASQLAGQLSKPVTDATGLKGKYDIGIYWLQDSMRASAPAAAGGGAASTPPTPEADVTGPTLLQAIQDQLGLRLEAKKGPVDILVVDHVEKLPTDN
jgi:uncharacterized protein (TIGR03435 family)